MIALPVHTVLLSKLRIHVVARQSCARFCFRCVSHKVGPLEQKTPKQPPCPPPSPCAPQKDRRTLYSHGDKVGVHGLLCNHELFF